MFSSCILYDYIELLLAAFIQQYAVNYIKQTYGNSMGNNAIFY